MTLFGFIYTGQSKKKISKKLRKQLEDNTWRIKTI